MKMKILKTLLAAVALMLVSGCVHTPETRIEYGKLRIRAPKDTDLTGLQITQMTNGAVQVTLQSYKARMNPDVISATAIGQAQLVQAAALGTGAALGEALKAFAASQGIPLPQATPAPPHGTVSPTGPSPGK